MSHEYELRARGAATIPLDEIDAAVGDQRDLVTVARTERGVYLAFHLGNQRCGILARIEAALRARGVEVEIEEL